MRFPLNICNGCGMPTENVHYSAHLVLSHLGTCLFCNVEINFSWTCLVSGLLSFEHPLVLLFCFVRQSIRSRSKPVLLFLTTSFTSPNLGYFMSISSCGSSGFIRLSLSSNSSFRCSSLCTFSSTSSLLHSKRSAVLLPSRLEVNWKRFEVKHTLFRSGDILVIFRSKNMYLKESLTRSSTVI